MYAPEGRESVIGTLHSAIRGQEVIVVDAYTLQWTAPCVHSEAIKEHGNTYLKIHFGENNIVKLTSVLVIRAIAWSYHKIIENSTMYFWAGCNVVKFFLQFTNSNNFFPQIFLIQILYRKFALILRFLYRICSGILYRISNNFI
jgi:hypothetical protein